MSEFPITDQDDVTRLVKGFTHPEQIWQTRVRSLTCAEHGETSPALHVAGSVYEDGRDPEFTATIDTCCQPFVDECLRELRRILEEKAAPGQ